jgi:hypothetical protein
VVAAVLQLAMIFVLPMLVVYALQVSLALLNSCLFYWFFFKNLNVVFVIGEHDFNSGFMKNFYIVWHLHLFGYFYVLVS